jgi:acetolactate synthase-1/2/3 large subunit
MPVQNLDKKKIIFKNKNISDLIVDTLVREGIKVCFTVTGGGSMFLNNSIGMNSKIDKFYLHNEQACSIAAEAYAKLTSLPALVCVTTGPGGINAINGVFGAYTDSVPMIVISGQVKRETIKNFKSDSSIRQLGDQENDIIKMISGITKKSELILSPKNIENRIKKFIKISKENRPGPVWIDVPIDIQNMKVK